MDGIYIYHMSLFFERTDRIPCFKLVHFCEILWETSGSETPTKIRQVATSEWCKSQKLPCLFPKTKKKPWTNWWLEDDPFLLVWDGNFLGGLCQASGVYCLDFIPINTWLVLFQINTFASLEQDFKRLGGLYPKLIMSRSLATSPARPETCANDLKDCQ